MANPALTRDEAAARAATPGRHLLRHRPRPDELRTRPSARPRRCCSAAATPGARPGSTSSRPGSSAPPSTAGPSDVRGYDGQRLALPGLAAENTLVVEAECAYSRTGEGLHRLVDPVDDEDVPVHPVRDRRRAARVRLLRPAGPQGGLHAGTSRPPRTGPSCPTATTPTPQPRARRGRPVGLRPPANGCPPTSTPWSPARSTPCATSTRAPHGTYPLGVFCRTSMAPSPRRRADLHRDQAGLRVLRGGVRPPLPVRQVRPALRARVQRRRDGERRLRDHHRGPHLPLPGDRGGLRAARQHDPARAGAHVVRRPRDHALVGRPVAQRVVRRVGLAPRDGRGHRLPARVDDVQQPAQDVGVPPGPAALDPSDRHGHDRPRGGQAQLRRHHLRQGRLGTAPAGRLGRREGVLRRVARVLHRSTRGATPTWPTCSSSWRRPPGATSPSGPSSGCAPPG